MELATAIVTATPRAIAMNLETDLATALGTALAMNITTALANSLATVVDTAMRQLLRMLSRQLWQWLL